MPLQLLPLFHSATAGVNSMSELWTLLHEHFAFPCDIQGYDDGGVSKGKPERLKGFRHFIPIEKGSGK